MTHSGITTIKPTTSLPPPAPRDLKPREMKTSALGWYSVATVNPPRVLVLGKATRGRSRGLTKGHSPAAVLPGG